MIERFFTPKEANEILSDVKKIVQEILFRAYGEDDKDHKIGLLKSVWLAFLRSSMAGRFCCAGVPISWFFHD